MPSLTGCTQAGTSCRLMPRRLISMASTVQTRQTPTGQVFAMAQGRNWMLGRRTACKCHASCIIDRGVTRDRLTMAAPRTTAPRLSTIGTARLTEIFKPLIVKLTTASKSLAVALCMRSDDRPRRVQTAVRLRHVALVLVAIDSIEAGSSS